ncbi:hypothetical protein [Aquimarina hainanensis]|uniref:hypothetical protein n=1 Tax=Aquimarina hainanensis TaxID=1578017 RepID=UPI0036156BC3
MNRRCIRTVFSIEVYSRSYRWLLGSLKEGKVCDNFATKKGGSISYAACNSKQKKELLSVVPFYSI